MRWLYTIYQILKNYTLLRKAGMGMHVNNVTYINSDFIDENKIKVLILDFDGVLSCHGDETVDDDVLMWLKEVIDNRPSLKICILSNKPLRVREDFFKLNTPSVDFIVAAKKKPYPDGINSVLKKYSINPRDACIVDDRLATGVLAGVISNIKTCYVYPPRARATKVETFFRGLRRMERFALLVS